MANNVDVIGDAATIGQIITNDFSATNGRLEDDEITKLRSYALYYCSTLTDVHFPNLSSLNSDGNQLGSCTNLTFADMGSVSTMRASVFASDSKLTAVVLRRTAGVCSLANVNAFNSTKYAANGAGGAYVYVPRDLISTYQAATNWATLYAAHSDMFRALEDYTVDGTTTGDFDESKL